MEKGPLALRVKEKSEAKSYKLKEEKKYSSGKCAFRDFILRETFQKNILWTVTE